MTQALASPGERGAQMTIIWLGGGVPQAARSSAGKSWLTTAGKTIKLRKPFSLSLK